MTIKKAILMVLDQLPANFQAHELTNKVKALKLAMDGTILRRYRELRTSGIVGYTYLDGVYNKTPTRIHANLRMPYGIHAGKRLNQLPTDYLTRMQPNEHPKPIYNWAAAHLQAKQQLELFTA